LVRLPHGVESSGDSGFQSGEALSAKATPVFYED
jgi:hypothetical protein